MLGKNLKASCRRGQNQNFAHGSNSGLAKLKFQFINVVVFVYISKYICVNVCVCCVCMHMCYICIRP